VDTTVKRPTVFVSYGFCEGPQIGRRFLRSLEQAGFQLTYSPEQADIFIGHSGGCLLTPSSSTSQVTIFIGFPYWPGKSLITTLMEKNRREYRISQRTGTARAWWAKLGWNSFYFWNMRRNVAMRRAMEHGPQTPAGPTVCLRNRDDDCCTPEIWSVSAFKKCAFISLAGEHDHLWMHPEAYTGIIKAYYGANVLASPETK